MAKILEPSNENDIIQNTNDDSNNPKWKFPDLSTSLELFDDCTDDAYKLSEHK